MNNSDLIGFFGNDNYAALTGVEIIEAKEGYCKAQLKITKKHLNAVNVVQGGAIEKDEIIARFNGLVYRKGQK